MYRGRTRHGGEVARACGRAEAPEVGPAVLKTEIQKLTGSIELRGLDAIGNAKNSAAIKKGGDKNGLRFTAPITRDGPGWRADLRPALRGDRLRT